MAAWHFGQTSVVVVPAWSVTISPSLIAGALLAASLSLLLCVRRGVAGGWRAGRSHSGQAARRRRAATTGRAGRHARRGPRPGGRPTPAPRRPRGWRWRPAQPLQPPLGPSSHAEASHHAACRSRVTHLVWRQAFPPVDVTVVTG